MDSPHETSLTTHTSTATFPGRGKSRQSQLRDSPLSWWTHHEDKHDYHPHGPSDLKWKKQSRPSQQRDSPPCWWTHHEDKHDHHRHGPSDLEWRRSMRLRMSQLRDLPPSIERQAQPHALRPQLKISGKGITPLRCRFGTAPSGASPSGTTKLRRRNSNSSANLLRAKDSPSRVTSSKVLHLVLRSRT